MKLTKNIIPLCSLKKISGHIPIPILGGVRPRHSTKSKTGSRWIQIPPKDPGLILNDPSGTRLWLRSISLSHLMFPLFGDSLGTYFSSFTSAMPIWIWLWIFLPSSHATREQFSWSPSSQPRCLSSWDLPCLGGEWMWDPSPSFVYLECSFLTQFLQLIEINSVYKMSIFPLFLIIGSTSVKWKCSVGFTTR